MCNRYVSPSEAEIERFWHIGRQKPMRWWKPDVFPRADGPFLRCGNELVVGQWGLIPFFAKSKTLPYSTNNCRIEGVTTTASFKQPWTRGQRCIIPAWSFDEPCWETGKNVWWTFRRADGAPWALAGLWNTWTDRDSGEVVESYTMLTMNADAHPVMSRMHKPDPKLPPDKQDKRSVVVLEPADFDQWLEGTANEALELVRLASADTFVAESS